MRYCKACDREFRPDEHETGDCPHCGESMWTARDVCVAMTAARAFAETLIGVSEDARHSALGELGLTICLSCWSMRDLAADACCKWEADNRKRLMALTSIASRLMDEQFKRQGETPPLVEIDEEELPF